MASDQDVQERLNAALTDRYRIESEIGSGGMATVYLAQDLRHDRQVAVKVLNPDLAAVVGTERFLAEIRTTANLSHPHILPLHDSGETDGFLFYVMPYVEGESLSDRLDREGLLPVEEAVRIAGHVADALGAAHADGVIHRDLKPGNILLQKGEPVVADFGIALAVSAAGEGRLTETGLSLGTPFYMSPEQAAGDETPTAASDVYSLGCVLYEMLTGEPPHTGNSAQAILGKILLADVTRPTKLRRTIPAHVEGAVLKALERLPADRFTSMTELAEALKDKAFRHGVGIAAKGGSWRAAALGLAAVMAVLLGAVLWAWPEESLPPVVRSNVALPPNGSFTSQFGPSLALSPDGSRMVYVGSLEEGGTALWVRDLDQLTPRLLPGTESGRVPFFSPDGRRVGFFSTREGAGVVLKAVDLAGGLPQEVADSGFHRFGGSWSADGYVYLQNDGEDHVGLIRIPGGGGEPEPITNLRQGEGRHAWPEVLPNGGGVLFTVLRQETAWDPTGASIAVVDLETREHRELMPGALARYASGHLLVVQDDGTLVAAPFDEDRLTAGDPLTIADDLLFEKSNSAYNLADVAVSENGTLVYAVGKVPDRTSELIWVDRDGTENLIRDERWEAAGVRSHALSPDDRRLAVSIRQENVGEHLWVKELPEGVNTRISMDQVFSERPVWSSDGRTLTYTASTSDNAHIRRARTDGSEVERNEILLEGVSGVHEMVWAPKERGFIFREGNANYGRGDIRYRDLEPGSEVVDLLATGFNERAVALSPDGRWMAYVSDVSGQDQVYVRPFPDVMATKWQASRDGGVEPVWGRDGQELFYRNPLDGWLMAATFRADSTFQVEAWTELFDASQYSYSPHWHGYDVTRDGQRFVFRRGLREGGELSLILVLNFFSELEERFTGSR